MSELDENYVVNNGKLFIGNRVVKLPLKVREVLLCEGILVVLVSNDNGSSINRNVFGVDLGGIVLWKIAESPHGGGNENPYMNIRILKNNSLVASNWNGMDYFVDVKTGLISVRFLAK